MDLQPPTETRSPASPPPTEAPPPSPPETYEAFYGPAIFQPCARVLLALAAPEPGEAVLDLACGTGIVARAVAPLVGRSGRVLALDVNPGMLAVGRARAADGSGNGGAPIDWRQGDASALDLPDASFDLALCQHGFQFFPDRAAAAAHVHRVLRPGGRFVAAAWRELELHPLIEGMAEAEAPRLGPLGLGEEDLLAPFSLASAEALRSLLEDAGFEGVEVHERSIEARFPGAETFVRNMERAYAAVLPRFAEDPEAFETFVREVAEETADLVARHTRDGLVTMPMHMHVVTGRRG